MTPTTTRLNLRLWTTRRARYISVVHALTVQHKPKPMIAKWQAKANAADGKVRQLQHKLDGHPHAIASTMRERAWTAAGTLLGIVEQGGNNQGAAVMRLIRANGGTGPEAWCGDANAWCYRAAGSKVVQRAWAAVRFLGFLTGMRVISAAQVRLGDIICFRWDHTGLFGWWADAHGRPVPRSMATHFVTREGNTSARGSMTSDSRSGGDGYRQKLHPISDAAGARFVHVTR